MCNIWKFRTKTEEESHPALLNKLTQLSFCNITGGESFLRADIVEITQILRQKAKRIVISTDGYFVQIILSLAKKYKDIGIRISIEGFSVTNHELRGIKDGSDRGLMTLLEHKKLTLKDIGFAIIVSDRNAKDLIPLFQLSKIMKMEFTTAVVHNSFYFHKYDNRIAEQENVIECFEALVDELLKTCRVKNWYRAYFNSGLINYIQGKPRLLPCTAGKDMFFLDSRGEIRPCNGMEKNVS